MNESRGIANPFPGLRPFETDEYRLFFGRDGQSDELLARLGRTRFLAVVGTSGSGKSSLVRAGLLPAMRGGLMAGAGSSWRIAVIRPGHDPIGNLACTLAESDVLPGAGGGLDGAEAEAVIEATLRSGSLGLVDAARRARLEEHENLLVVVDQFEELFRFRGARASTSTGDDASAFVKLLLEAARQRELPVYVVLTMRSDFLGDCSQFQGLPEAINDGQYLIPRMTRDERRVAITGPVAVARGRLAQPLVNRLLNDVGDNPDQLPILQHALMRTWDFWKQNRLDGEPIGVGDYEAIGTMSDALSRHADEAFNELDERQKKIAERMFKALTEKGADNREIRRPARLAEVCAIVEATPEEVVAVIEVFRRKGRSFLMPPVGVDLEADTVIDISHESLIRNWVRLREWVNEEGECAHMYRRLVYAAEAGSYISGVYLDTALDWRNQYKPNVAWASRYHSEVGLKVTPENVTTFLDASAAHRDALRQEEEKRRQAEIERERRELEHAQAFAKQQQRAKRRLVWLAGALCLILLFALVMAVSAMRAKAKAVKTQMAGTAYREALSALKIKDVDDARTKLVFAATQFTELRDISGAAASYMELGDTYFNGSLGKIDWEEGAKYYDKANELSQNNDDFNSKAPVLRAMGSTFINAARAVLELSGDKERARKLLDKGQRALERAREIYQSKNDQDSEIVILNQLGESVSDGRFSDDPKEDYRNAIKYYDQILAIYDKQKNSSSEIKNAALPKYKETALKLADIADGKLGDLAAANKYREMAVNALGEIGGMQAKADMLLEIARSFGPGEQQTEYQKMAARLYEDSTDRRPEAEILRKIADMQLDSYKKTTNRVNLREGPGTSFEIIKLLAPNTNVIVLGDDGKWLRVTVENQKGFILGAFAQGVGDSPRSSLTSALDYYQRAFKIYETLRDTPSQKQLLDKIATINERLAQFPQALKAREELVKLSSNSAERGSGLSAIGDLQDKLGRLEAARASFENALESLNRPEVPVDAKVNILKKQLEGKIDRLKNRLAGASAADMSSPGKDPRR